MVKKMVKVLIIELWIFSGKTLYSGSRGSDGFVRETIFPRVIIIGYQLTC